MDFVGARGSNTGDVYHELWAVRNALRLLDSANDLKAVTVEGVPSADGRGRQWDGVDCTLLFGGESIQTADRLVIQQLKYSASVPTKSWSVPRVCYGPSAEDPSSSVMRGLGKAFRGVVGLRLGKQLSDITMELVTNQPVSNQLLSAIEEAKDKGVPQSFKRKWRKGDNSLHRLVYASGLKPEEFQNFSKCLKFVGPTSSRFFLEERMLLAISKWTISEFVEVANRLRKFVRNKMLPEAAGEIINKESVLLQFEVSDQRALFPCPSKLEPIQNLVSRSVSKELCQSVVDGYQRILLHGSGGVGKSTIVQELRELLLDGSEVVAFDCYGAGSYMDASALRHRSHDAFVQLANELANRLHIPAFLEPKSNLDFARAFRSRLLLAAKTLSNTQPGAKLVIVIDAADNSISAAASRVPKEGSFVTELASFEELPENVSLIVSARTSRLDELNLPSSFKHFELLPFDCQETGKFVAHHWDAPENWVDDFHRLTKGIPRVQNYAFGRVSNKPYDALKPLLPKGKTLDEIFEEQFEEAVKKAGQAAKVEETCAALAILPRPIPLSEISYAVNMSEAKIADICSDLEPGVRLLNDNISFADEDFEHFAREKGKKSIPATLSKVALRLLANYKSSEYAALNVVPLLFKAGLGNELLDLVESEPEPSAWVMSDPLLRMETRNQRLTNAIGVCRSAENLERAMRYALIGAEALETNDATRKILADFPDLTARFAETTGSRLILSEPDFIQKHGPLLLSMLSQEAVRGNFSQVREISRRVQAWCRTRSDTLEQQKEQYGGTSGWRIGAADRANALTSRALEGGAGPAIQLFRNWPIGFAVDAALIAIRRLIVAEEFKVLQGIGKELSPPLAAFVLVPLCLARQSVDLQKLARGLRMLSRRYPVSAESLKDRSNVKSQIRKVSEILITGAEILAAHNVYVDLVKAITHPLWLPEARRCDRLYDSQSRMIDGIMRSYCLYELCLSGSVDTENILVEPPADLEDKNNKKKKIETDSERNVKSIVKHVTPFYVKRAKVLLQKMQNDSSEECEAELMKSFSHDHWRFDRNYWELRLRSIMSEGLVVLTAANTDADRISKIGFEITKGIWPQAETSAAKFFSSLTVFSSLHDDLLKRATAAVSEIAGQRMGARKKSELLAQIAELIMPISSEDANVVFQRAIAVAQELDSEAIDQALFLHTLTRTGSRHLSSEKRHFASKAAEFVLDAGIRLDDVEYFPWEEAIGIISTLDFPTALACIARWEDSGYVGSRETLLPLIQYSLNNGDIDFVQAASMLKLVDLPSVRTILDILIKSRSLGVDTRHRLVEEFARDLVTGTIDASTEIEDFLLDQRGGVWLERLHRQKQLKTAIVNQPEPSSEQLQKDSQSKSILAKKVWEQATLSKKTLLYPAAKELLSEARANGEYISLANILLHASSQVQVGGRVKFLTSLIAIVVEQDEQQVVETLISSINSWSSLLSVEGWCVSELPKFIEDALPFLASRYDANDTSDLEKMIALTKLDRRSAQQVILRGIEKNSRRLSSRQIFSLMKFLAGSLDEKESASLLSWYLDRLVDRIDNKYKEKIDLQEIPESSTHAIANFIAAYMSDVDLRLRWKAAHAGRRLARFGRNEELTMALEFYGRKKDEVFRAAGKPYYWLAVRLWMMIMFDRISQESASTIGHVAPRLLQIAFDQSFPHILVRDFAADACRKLHQAGFIKLTNSQLAELLTINSGIPTTGANTGPSVFHDFRDFNRETERFHFDTMDTLRYWYAPWLRVFEGASPKNIQNEAEKWIVDEWEVVDEEPYGFREPRENRFKKLDLRLYSNSHGSLPTMEQYRTHLEWHAKWCMAGKFLAQFPLKKSDYSDADEYSELRNQISYGKLTKPPYWLADIVTNRPLESHHWSKEFKDASEWVENIHDSDFLRELFPEAEPEWVVVDEYIKTESYSWEVTSEIDTGLVSPGTAMSLVRALQMSPNDMDFYVCPEGHDLEIDETDFQLKGWIRRDDDDRKYDAKDPLRMGVSRPRCSPGSGVSEFLGLQEMLRDGLRWVDSNSGHPVFRLEIWGDKGTEERHPYFGDGIVSSGRRLLITRSALSEFLQSRQCDLIADIGITRSDTSQGKQNVFEETTGAATYNRVLLLERFGEIRGAEQNFGSWRTDCK